MHKYTAFAILGFLVLTVYGLGFSNNQGFNIQNNPVTVNTQASQNTTAPNFNINNPALAQQNSNTQTTTTTQNNINTQNSLNPQSFSINNPSISTTIVGSSLSTDSFATGTCVANQPQLPAIVRNTFNQLCSLGGSTNPLRDFCNALNSMNQPLTPPSQCALIGAKVLNQSCTTTVNLPYAVCRSYWNSGWQATWYGACPSCPSGYVRDSCDSAWWDFALSSKTYCHKDTTVVGQCPSGESVVSTSTQPTTLNGNEAACDTTMIISNVNVIVNALSGTASVSWTDSVYGNATVSYSGPVSGSQSTPLIQGYNHNIVLTGLTNGNYNLNIQSCNSVSGCGSYNGAFNIQNIISFLQIQSPTNTSYYFNTPIFMNFTVNGSAPNYNASYSLTGYAPVQFNAVNGFNSLQLPNLNLGNYVLNLTVSAGIQTSSQSVSFSIVNATANVSLTANSWNVVYGNTSNVSCSSNVANASLQLYDNGVAVSNPDVEILGVGTYNYTCELNAYGYNTANASNTLTISQAQTTTSVLLNNSNSNLTIIYGDSIIANYSANAGTTSFYLNGSIISNNYNTSGLSAGYYNFTAITDGGVNYSNSSDSKFLTINPASSQTTVFLNGSNSNLTIIYGNSVIANYTSSSTATLYLNGSIISNNYNTSGLSAGYYNFTAIANSGLNSSGSSDSEYLTIQQAPSTINLTLNGVDGDINVLQNSIVNITVYTNFNDLVTTTISNLSGMVYSANSTSFNFTASSGSYYTVTSSFAGDVNYTPSSATHTIGLTGLNFSNLVEYSTPSAQQYSGVGESFNCNYTDGYGNEIQNASVYVEIGNASYPTAFNNNYFYNANLPAGNYSWYCNATSANYQPQVGSVQNFTVLPISPNYSYSYINASNTTVGIPSNVVIFIGGFNGTGLSNVSISLYSSRNDTIAPLNEMTDANGFANFTVNSTIAGVSNLTAVVSGFNLSTQAYFNPESVASIIVSPSNASISMNSTQQFNASAFDSYNNSVPVNFTWSVSNSTVGSVDVNGLFTSSSVGTTDVTASNGSVNGSASVIVIPGNISSIIVSCPNSTIQSGDSVQCTASAFDSFNDSLNASFVWSEVNYTGTGIVDTNGLFTGFKAGIVEVDASSGNVTGSFNVTITPGVPSVLIVSASPQTLTVGNPSSISAIISDAYGNVIYNGSVDFNTSLGVFASSNTSTAVDSIISGSANDSLTSNTSGTANVTAQYGSLSNSTLVTVTSGSLSSIIVSCPNSTIQSGVEMQCSASGFDSWNNPVNANFTWSVSNFTGTGFVNASGAFTGENEGIVEVDASSDNVSGSFNVTVTPGSLSSIILSASPSNLPVNNTSLISISLYDLYGNPVNATVVLSVNDSSNTTYNLQVNGSGSINITETIAGFYNINANSTGVSNSTTITFTALNASQTNSTITPPQTLPVNSTANVSISLKDAYGNPVQDLVEFFVNGNPVNSTIANASGDASFSVYSNQSGLFNITAEDVNNSFNLSTFVQFNALNASTILINAASPVTAGSINQVNFTVSDAYGNPVNDILNVSIGNSTQQAQIINGFGQINFSENASGIYGITAVSTTNGAANSTSINVIAGSPTILNISANPMQVNTGGNSTITISLTDAFGNPVSNATIDFNSTSLLSQNSSVTDSNGTATVNLTANAGSNAILAFYSLNPSVNNTITITGIAPNYNVSILVEDGNYNPIPNANVSVTSYGVYNTNANGTVIVQMTEGNYLFTAYDAGYSSAQQNLTINANTQIIFVLQKLGVLNGTVNSANGSAINALITFGNYSTTAVNGVFSVSNVVPGVYNITSSASGFANSVLFNIPVYSGNTTDVSITMNPLGGVNGTVVDALNGNPIANANVTITQNGVLAAFGLTNATGSYHDAGIPAGYYNVTVTATGYGSLTRDNVIVSQGSVSTINFAM